MNNTTTIPLLVDDVKTHENFEMTRLVYFSIETVDYLANLSIEYDHKEYPVTVLDLHGIITETLDKNEFNTADSIDELFDSIEKNEELFVDTNDVWLPNQLFRQKRARGDLIRVSSQLFKQALAFRSDKLSYSDFLKQTSEMASEITESPVEDKAFKEWSRAQIKFAIEAYLKRDPEKNLKYKES